MTQIEQEKPEMSSTLLKEYSERIGNVRFKKDFKIFTEEQKKSISKIKKLSEQKIGRELSRLNDRNLKENRANFKAQKSRILSEMARYERICILEAISENTANQMAEQSKGILSAIAVFGEISPEINQAAKEKGKNLMMHLEALEDLSAVGGLGGAAKKHLNESKKLFTDLISIFKACDALGEAYFEDDGKINRDVLQQIFNWANKTGQSKLLESPTTLQELFEKYDEAVPSGEIPMKKGWFGSKIFGKKSTEKSTQSTVEKFIKKVSEVIKEKSPISVGLAPGLASSMLSESFYDNGRMVYRFNSIVSNVVDLELLNKIATTSWMSNIKSFFGSAGGASAGSGFRVI